MLATNLCVMCFICYDYSVYVLIFSSRLRRGNTPGGREWVPVVVSLSMAGDITRVCYVLLLHLCILSVGFIWKNGCNVVSSLLVCAILLFVTNFSKIYSVLKFVLVFI